MSYFLQTHITLTKSRLKRECDAVLVTSCSWLVQGQDGHWTSRLSCKMTRTSHSCLRWCWKSGAVTKQPRSWRGILLNSSWKGWLIYSNQRQEKHVSEIHSLRSNQEETDTRIILYLQHAVTEGYQSAIIRSPDSDIFFILLHYAHQLDIIVYMDSGTGKHRRLINITETAHALGTQYTSSLLGLYCFTGVDCNCAFKGQGKVEPLKKLENTHGFRKSSQNSDQIGMWSQT